MIPFIIRYNRAFIALALVLTLAGWLWHHDRQVIAQDRLEAAVEARRIDAIADDVAGQIAASEAATVEKQNDDARKAAIDSSDPLADGLRSLRDRKTSHR